MPSVDVCLQLADNYIVPFGWVFSGCILHSSGISTCARDGLWFLPLIYYGYKTGIAQSMHGYGWDDRSSVPGRGRDVS